MSRQRIDVHTHYLGGVVGRMLEGSSPFKKSATGLAKPIWTPADAIAFMDRHEIATQVLSIPMVPASRPDDPEFVARFAREVNEDYAKILTEHPDRFGAFASVPLDTPDHALREIEYALDTLNLDGVVLPSNAYGKYFGDPFYEPILAELDRRQVPIFVHPVDCPHIDELGFGRSSSLVEFPFDTARNITNAIYRGVFRRHPDLKVILAHAGGALPTLAGRIKLHGPIGCMPGDANVDAEHITEVLRGLYYEVALSGSAGSLVPALHATGMDHILFGTDWPIAPEPVVDMNIADLLRYDGFATDEWEDVDRGNAVRLFRRLG